MTFTCLASTTDIVLGRYGHEPGLDGVEISSMERGRRAGARHRGDAVALPPFYP